MQPKKSTARPTYLHQVYVDKKGDYRWRVTHKNGNIIADSGQGYSRAIDAKNAFHNMVKAWDSSQFSSRPSFVFEPIVKASVRVSVGKSSGTKVSGTKGEGSPGKVRERRPVADSGDPDLDTSA